MEDVMIRWANDDAPVPTSSELFFKILTPSHSSLLTPLANSQLRLRHCAGDRSERAVRRSTESCRGGGGKAQQSPWWREVAPRVELFPSLSVLSHTCWLSIRWMSQRTERILWFDLTIWIHGDMLCKINTLQGRVEVTNQFHRKFREHQNKCKICPVKQEMVFT